MTCRQLLIASGVGILSLFTPKISEKGIDFLVSEVEARPYKTSDKLYEDALPADYVMPGARIIDRRKSYAKDEELLFKYDDWTDYYFVREEIHEDIQTVFKNLDDKCICVNTPHILNRAVIFDFKKFHDYNVLKKGRFMDVSLYSKGFMVFRTADDNYALITPINTGVIDTIKDMLEATVNEGTIPDE
ncbi:hypothetical protein J4434_08655 [Candidatus Woesearchaeota archaeon]|nr:hypothetical protein [Candidatus Woesearchaeota archaeon]